MNLYFRREILYFEFFRLNFPAAPIDSVIIKQTNLGDQFKFLDVRARYYFLVEGKTK